MNYNSRRHFIKKSLLSLIGVSSINLLSCSVGKNKSPIVPSVRGEVNPYFNTRGVVVGWDDIISLDWPYLAHQAGLTTIGVHLNDAMMATEEYKKFIHDCDRFGIAIEYEQHAMSQILPRNLFSEHPSMFRMNEEGVRTNDYNCCASSAEALKIIAENAQTSAKKQVPKTGRYYFWLDDGGKKCHCPLCKELNDSDQALLIENAIIKKLKELDKSNTLAHLAYTDTIVPPKKVKPEAGIFLEYAPFQRVWDKPLSDRLAKRDGMTITHGDYIDYLEANLKIFPKETTQILEYWLDVSLFSGWKKPPVKLPFNREALLSDIETYAKMGIKNITTFAVYVGGEYQKLHQDISFVSVYGNALKSYTPEKS